MEQDQLLTVTVIPLTSDIFLGIRVSVKRKYALLSSRVLKTEGGQMKSRGCTTPTIEVVPTSVHFYLSYTLPGF